MEVVSGVDPGRVERVNDLVAYLGNSVWKCVLHRLVQPNEELATALLRSRVLAAQEPAGAVTYGLTATAQLLGSSHTKVGALTDLRSTRNKVWEVGKPADSRLSDAVTGHMLGLAAYYGSNLERLLGGTSAPVGSIRSPVAVMRLAGFFATRAANEKIGLQTVTESTGLKYTTAHSQIRRLFTNGYVQYGTTLPSDEAPAQFKVVAGANPLESTLTRTGARKLRKYFYGRQFTYRIEAGHVVTRLLEQGIDTFTYADIIAGFTRPQLEPLQVQEAVQRMLREGIVARVNRPIRPGDTFSDIRCTPAQKRLMDHIAAVYKGLVENDDAVINEGIGLGSEVLGDKEMVAQLLKNDWLQAAARRRGSFAERAATVIAALELWDDEISTAELYANYFDEDDITIDALGNVLRSMARDGKIKKRKSSRENYWRLSGLADDQEA